MAGLALPVRPYRRQLWFTGPFGAVPTGAPVLFDTGRDFYFRREGAGVVMCLGDPSEPPGYGSRPSWGFAERVAEYATRRFPAFGQASIANAIAAPRDITPDHEPVLGPLPGVAGFYSAAGHGFMLAPAVGRALAELIVYGRSDPDLAMFSISRFQGQPLDEAAYRATGV
jgi:sarcosine oxidase subunit beta